MWLAWDIGENVNSLLQIKKNHFKRQEIKETNEPEYLVFLPKEILKRTRTARSEPTLYLETSKLLDDCLLELKDEDYLFDFDYRNAKKIFDRAGWRANATANPAIPSPANRGPISTPHIFRIKIMIIDIKVILRTS